MRISRSFHWHAVKALVVAIAVVATLLLIGGVTNPTPPGGTFQLTDAAAPASTATKLVTFPVSPVVQGSMVQLTATVTPAAPGTVQFKDGTANLGNPVIVSNGTASGTTSQLPTGTRQLTAVFTPADLALFTVSTSPVVPFEVMPAKQATDTRTALTTSPSSSIDQGAAVTLIATVTPATAPGTVQFKDGPAAVGTPVTVSNGRASMTTLQLPVGTRQLTAVFSPADPANFNPSTSPVVSLTVIDSSQTVTSQVQQSGQSLDGPTVLDGQGLTVLDLGGANDGLGVTLLDGANASVGPGLTVLDLGGINDGQLNVRRGLTVLDGRGLTVLRTGGDGGLLSELLRSLL